MPAIQVDVPGDAISPIRDVAHLYSQTHLRATARPRLGRSGLIAGVDLQHPPGQNFGQPSKIPRQIPGTSAGHFRAAVNSEMAACSGHPGGLHHHPGRDRSVCWAIVVSPSDLYFRAHIFLSFARLTGPRNTVATLAPFASTNHLEAEPYSLPLTFFKTKFMLKLYTPRTIPQQLNYVVNQHVR